MQSMVFIDQLALSTYIGLHKWEMTDRQTVFCDIQMSIDINEAAQTDDVATSANYEAISNHLRTWAHNHRCQLLEKLAYSLVAEITSHHPAIQQVKLRLTKVGVVPHTKGCGVEVTYTR
jgi:dihydroneopterin aldolase